jgi:outer membrane protein
MRKALIATVVLLAVISAAPALAESNVGFVDFGKVLELTDKGRTLQAKLSATKDELEIKIQGRELALRKLQEELKTKKDVMAKEVFEGKMQEFQQKLMEYQQAVQESSAQFEKLRVKQIRGFVSEIEVVVSDVATQNGFSLVIMKFEDFITNSSIILYGDSSVELTDKVIKKLNEK